MLSLAQGSWLALGGSSVTQCHHTAWAWMCHHPGAQQALSPCLGDNGHCSWCTQDPAGHPSLIHDPTPASPGNSGFVTAGGRVSPISQNRGSYPSQPCPLCSSQGSCGSLGHQQHSWTPQSCSSCSPAPQPCPAQPGNLQGSQGSSCVLDFPGCSSRCQGRASSGSHIC